MDEGKKKKTDCWSHEGGKFEREKDETRDTLRKKQDNVSCGSDILFFILSLHSLHISISTRLLTPLSPFSSPCFSSPVWSDSCLLRPIWKEFAQPLKCMFCATFIPFLSCFFFFSSSSPQRTVSNALSCISKDWTQTRHFQGRSSDPVEDKTNVY